MFTRSPGRLARADLRCYVKLISRLRSGSARGFEATRGKLSLAIVKRWLGPLPLLPDRSTQRRSFRQVIGCNAAQDLGDIGLAAPSYVQGGLSESSIKFFSGHRVAVADSDQQPQDHLSGKKAHQQPPNALTFAFTHDPVQLSSSLAPFRVIDPDRARRSARLR